MSNPEGKAMVLALRTRNDLLVHVRGCPDCDEATLCPRGHELEGYATMAHETVMDFILGAPTPEDSRRAEQALRTALKEVWP